MRAFLAALMLAGLIGPAFAVDPGEMLADKALEARARAISENLRCLVCQNQSIDDSDADLARDLRVIVRERLTAGDSDEAAMQYIVDRYGEFVLLKPVLAPHTVFLWLAAPLILLGGAGLILAGARRRASLRNTEGLEPVMSEAEQAVLENLRSDAAGVDAPGRRHTPG